MSEEERLKAYGKLNLYLDVLDKRPDGFHDIITLFQGIELHDEITIRKNARQTNTFSVSYDKDIPFKPALIWDENNIIFRVFSELERHTGKKLKGYDIELLKRLPPESGLGGASADAAAIIRYFSNRFNFDHKLTLEIAKAIGSDVTFPLYGGTAIGTLRGEHIKKMNPLPAFPVLLCQPVITFSTSRMYSVIDSLRFEDWDNIEDVERVTDFEDDHEEEQINDPVLDDWEDSDVESWVPEEELYRVYDSLMDGEYALTFNDFERAAQELEIDSYEKFSDEFNAIKGDEILLKGMTGSGSSHFIVFKQQISDTLLQEYAQRLSRISAWVRRTKFY